MGRVPLKRNINGVSYDLADHFLTKEEAEMCADRARSAGLSAQVVCVVKSKPLRHPWCVFTRRKTRKRWRRRQGKRRGKPQSSGG